jgi:hypothetical protein
MLCPSNIPYRKLCYLGLCHLYHLFEQMTILWMKSSWHNNCLAVLVEEVQSLLMGLGVSVSACGEIIP